MPFHYTCCSECFQEVKNLFVATWGKNVSVNGSMLVVDFKDPGLAPPQSLVGIAWKGVREGLPHGLVVKQKESGNEKWDSYECDMFNPGWEDVNCEGGVTINLKVD